MLTEYGELEVTMMNCVQVARKDLDGTLKALYRTRGEKQRIDIADGLGRYVYSKFGLETEFSMAIGAIRHALKIRNQYAHCIWHRIQGRLYFIALEELANSNNPVLDLGNVRVKEINADLLKQQEVWFLYADAWLAWVNFEGRHLIKQMAPNPLPKPKQLKPPLLHIGQPQNIRRLSGL